MTKDILIQYCDLQEEIKDLHNRIQKQEEQIKKLEAAGAVIDSVKGGEGGIQNFKISGFPYPEYSKKKTKLYLYKAQLENAELESLETLNSVEEYIQSISDSMTRTIFRMYFIDKSSQLKIGKKLGYDQSRISQIINDFFEQ